MIVGSVVLVLAAGVLLGLGLVFLDAPLLYSSIGVSALAALALVAGVRRMTAVRAGQGVITVRPGGATLGLGRANGGPGTVTGRATPRPVGRAQVVSPVSDVDPTAAADEPAAEVVSEPDVARLRGLDAEVVVVDGRPRYHLADCTRVLDLDHEALPVAEAVELDFTPCGQCRPAATLLRTADGE